MRRYAAGNPTSGLHARSQGVVVLEQPRNLAVASGNLTPEASDLGAQRLDLPGPEVAPQSMGERRPRDRAKRGFALCIVAAAAKGIDAR